MVDPVTPYDRSGSQDVRPPDSGIGHRCQATIGLGLCLGASTISAALVSREPTDFQSKNPLKSRIVRKGIYSHEGDPKQTLLKALSDFDPSTCHRMAITGRRLREGINLSSISEPEAVEYAYRYLKPADIDCPAIVSAGGETFMVYALDLSGNICKVTTGNKCASGTGEFFLQQLRRMNVSLQEASRWSETETPYPVSGRCSVFCKSDCTHATNKGVPRARVAAGLCRMMAEKILDLLKNIPRHDIMLVGGTTKNRMMIAYLHQYIDNLIIPREAHYFEALGAALWALDHPTRAYSKIAPLFSKNAARFDRLAPIGNFRHQVTFETISHDTANDGDVCLLGLDVGSTTTKAVLLRQGDHALLASVYLRTKGDPVAASRNCYGALLDQIKETAKPESIHINGLGVCGSGRQIAGLHAQTDGVINEIVAHTTAAVYFDSDVDTLFEIGGQDAKYTHITAGVASDYAMNEACSAGTGSFLEESALETLGVDMQEIADYALLGQSPPNFNDQCAAFISSDIKNAIHEGICREDIVAGLVYSICMNYTNRVKGNRPVGQRIFMQGGVCYNRAVPMAMAALVGKPIVVPPEPGLMGAFGVALEVEKRMQAGLMEPSTFDLQELSQRQAAYGKSFICRGGSSGCDRRCEIAMVRIEGKKIPFGGACNRYYNLHRKLQVDADALDLVKKRQDIIVGKRPSANSEKTTATSRPTVGINRSFLFHSYYPLYAAFFEGLGFDVSVPDTPSHRGIAERGAPFCYPAELSHGFFHRLIETDPPPDYLFLPHVKALHSQSREEQALLCPFVQAEPYLLRTTFRRHLERFGFTGDRILSPVIDLTGGFAAARAPLLKIARQMRRSPRQAMQSFDRAMAAQQRSGKAIHRLGQQAMQTLAEDPQRMAAVIFGRPYNAWASEAHMGIPRKLASRGVPALPLDCLPLSSFPIKHHMYWAMGQRIIQAARLAADHPQLFGVYITNFSCGPDSFIINYFRRIMGGKPSLTLELDSHTADAGLETRIEAFLDVVNAWRGLKRPRQHAGRKHAFRPARVVPTSGVPGVRTSNGGWLPLSDDRVTLLFPSMGRLSSEALASAFASQGIHSIAARPADETVLKRGRANTACKECLPLILTTGTLLEHIEQHRFADDVLVYFMATGAGPCRFGQYRIFMEDLIRDRKIEDVALFSLDSEDGYSGLDRRIHLLGWQAVVIADAMEDARSMLLANATDPVAAIKCFNETWDRLVRAIGSGRLDSLDNQLARTAEALKGIVLKQPAEKVPTIALVGEIFVRRDGISRQYITEHLARMGFACICAPVAEWIHYADWLVRTGRSPYGDCSWRSRIGLALKQRAMRKAEIAIKQQLSRSGLIHPHIVDIPTIIRHARPHLAPDHLGEAVLTIGTALREVVSNTCGVIAIGPFGCMPNRIAESILSETMTADDKLNTAAGDHRLRDILDGVSTLPFLSIESDGSPFPQIITAKLEAFCLQAAQLHERLHPPISG